MLAILNILRKTFVTEYYRLNTGFLFLVAMFAFGILRPEDHIALASYVFASPFLLVLMGLLFGLYHLKTVYFVRQRMLWNSHSFLFQLLLIPKPQRWVSWLYVQWMLWLPVALYVIFVSYYGWWTGEKGSVIATILYLFCVPLVGVAAYEYRLHRPNPDTRISIITTYFNRRFTKPQWFYFVLYLFSENPVLLFLTKGFTCILIVAVCRIYPTDRYDERLFSLAALTIGLVHSVIVLHMYEFEHLQLPLLRNLPLPLGKRFGQYGLFFIVLLLPETLFLFRYLPQEIEWDYVFVWWLLLMGILSLLYGRFLQYHYTMDLLLRQCFYTFFVGFFLIMFRLPVYLLAVSCLGGGVWLFHRYYYLSEYLVHQDGLKSRPED